MDSEKIKSNSYVYSSKNLSIVWKHSHSILLLCKRKVVISTQGWKQFNHSNYNGVTNEVTSIKCCPLASHGGWWGADQCGAPDPRDNCAVCLRHAGVNLEMGSNNFWNSIHIQEKFRSAIFKFEDIISNTMKLGRCLLINNSKCHVYLSLSSRVEQYSQDPRVCYGAVSQGSRKHRVWAQDKGLKF